MEIICRLLAFAVSVISVQGSSLIFGDDVAPEVQLRLISWFEVAPDLPTQYLNISIIVGKTADSSTIISDEEIEDLDSVEGFISRSSEDCGTLAIRGGSFRGNTYGGYWFLELIGIKMMHPLEPTILMNTPISNDDLCSINLSDSPHWPLRGWHYHTQHPLELTEVLNGFDSVGTNGTTASWESMLPQVDLFFQWCLANRLNFVEWLLLYAKEYEEFASSEERKTRLYLINEMAHNITLLTSADVPIALRQQHSWFMIENANDTNWQSQIDERLQWVLMDANFDFLGTESGSTEFTHTSCETMLSWINYTALAVQRLNKKVFIKCHISNAGICPDYNNINFNFLPQYSEISMGILPHTVQTFSFDDLSSNSYGQENFTFMFNWMFEMAKTQPNRDNLFYGETAYWVNFDINVPLFLPLYGDRRIYDLRKMQNSETDEIKFNGQMNFCSGWEWGYWIQEVMTARASWSVLGTSEGSQEEALRLSLKPIASSLVGSNSTLMNQYIDFFVKYIHTQNELLINGSSSSSSSSSSFKHQNIDILSSEHQEQVEEEYGSAYKANGHAYLEGWEAMSDVEFIGNALNVSGANTQPAHISLRLLLQGDVNTSSFYDLKVKTLLFNINVTFYQLQTEFLEMISNNDGGGERSYDIGAELLISEISDAIAMTSLRASQVTASYAAADAFRLYSQSVSSSTTTTSIDEVFLTNNMVQNHKMSYDNYLTQAREAIESAQVIVSNRELNYRSPVDRIGSWRWTPTSYTFGYLWTTHSLLYWWRDYGIVSQQSIEAKSPCYLNYQSPVDIAIGEGSFQNIVQRIRDHYDGQPPFDLITDCLAAPEAEMTFPDDL